MEAVIEFDIIEKKWKLIPIRLTVRVTITEATARYLNMRDANIWRPYISIVWSGKSDGHWELKA